jgi:hypothetical protein
LSIFNDSLDAVCKGFGIAWRSDEAVLSVIHDIATVRGRNDWQARCRGLGKYNPEPVRERGEHKHVGLKKFLFDPVARYRSCIRGSLEFGAGKQGLIVPAHHAHLAVNVSLLEQASGFSQVRNALQVVDVTDKENLSRYRRRGLLVKVAVDAIRDDRGSSRRDT